MTDLTTASAVAVSARTEDAANDWLFTTLDDLQVLEYRMDAAIALAAWLGCQRFILCARTPERDTYFPLRGFPQSLPEGAAWQQLIQTAVRETQAEQALCWPYAAHELRPSYAFRLTADLILILDGMPDRDRLARLRPLLKLLARSMVTTEVLDTRQEKAEAALRAQTSAHEAILRALSNLGEAVAMTVNGKLIYANPTFSRLFPAEADGSPRHTAAMLAGLRRLNHGETLQMTVVDGNGDPIDLEAVHTYADGRDLFLLLNVTDRRRAEQLESDNRRLADIDRIKSEFLATMSHELRTPLNSIIGFSSLLLDCLTDALQRRYVEYISIAGESLLALINQVLDLSRLDAGRMILDISHFNVNHCVERAVGAVGPMADKRGLRIEVETCDTPLWVESDELRVAQILSNILSNAIKFSSPGTIRVNCHQTDQVTSVTVVDNGPGIAEGERKLLFEPFQQLSSSRGAQAGTGLGLYFSRKLARLLGGDLALDPTHDAGGASFTLTLPMNGPSHETNPSL